MSAYPRPLTKPRPVYLNLFRIRIPLPSIVSFLHRVTGVLLLVFGIPLVLSNVAASLASPESYEALKQTLSQPFAKLVIIVLAWAFLHHFCAGIRHLLLDLHKGIELPAARRSGAAVLALSVALTLIVAVKLW